MSRPALMVDLDGTLFIIGDRSPYDADNCGVDAVNPGVLQIMRWAQAAGWAIVLNTARGYKDTHRKATLDTLFWQDIAFDAIYFREPGDGRPDVVVKREKYRTEISDEWDVRMVLEDTLELCVMWREEFGLFCAQVDHRRMDMPAVPR